MMTAAALTGSPGWGAAMVAAAHSSVNRHRTALSFFALSWNGGAETAEYHSRKNIRGDVTTAPLGVEVFCRRSGHGFIDCLACGNQGLDTLSNLHQHVTVVLQVCASG